MKANRFRNHSKMEPRITRITRMLSCRGSRVGCNRLPIISHQLSAINQSSGFSLIVALVMVALTAVIAAGVFTAVSLERGTATSYSSRYQADLAAQNGLQAAAKTLAASSYRYNSLYHWQGHIPGRASRWTGRETASPQPTIISRSPRLEANPTITYYPLFSSSTDPNTPDIQTQNIVLAASDPRAAHAPLVPPPAPPANSSNTDPGAAWNAAGTQRLPSLYSWQQPSPSPSGPSVKWVEMRDPQDAAQPCTTQPSLYSLCLLG